ncbi:LytR/AlgR family response regulator transcription factor [Chitinophaga tropicalis]|uniref:Response regulator n=1 Tax=Chitinophaga tropicalis TaxID=2683588 RepID=A0A7K1UDI0_9BACT|nr:LytTR family DNA-binding domain-containing protein [Chitinophaga tropicalis]MVT12328.1 response regulator [Chitinophaga tropicalis]
MNCIIVDDEPYALEVLGHYIAQTPELCLQAAFRNTVEAFEYLSRHTTDLLFLDIEMPLVNGISFLKALREPPKTIFTTAYKQYAFEGYELEVVDYLLKPFSFERFSRAIQKVNAGRQEPKPVQGETLLMKDKEGLQHIRQEEIIYIEGSKDYIKINTAGRPYIFYHTLKGVLDKLDPHVFIQVHRSYIVNRQYIRRIRENRISLHDGVMIPIGRSYREDLIRFLKG